MCKKSKSSGDSKKWSLLSCNWFVNLKSKCSEKEEHEVREEEQEPLQRQEASDMPPKTYYPLTPTDEAKESESYLDALSWALSQNEIRNIAISGPYGSGKSSVIRTFFKKNPIYKYITISLANFNGGKDESTTEANKNESVQVDVKAKKGGKEQQSLSGLSDSQIPASDLEQRIERSIVQQLFYHEKDEKIPFSHFKKIHNDTPCDIHTETVCILLLIVSCVVLFFPTFFWKLPILKFLAYTERELFTLIAVFVVLSCLYVVIKKARKEILKHIKFRVSNAEIDLNANDDKSILNYYIDEIIYFFEATRKEIVIFEDLDRFNSRDIFVKLREINYLINNCKKIEQNVVFLYAIKDDVFIGKEKTKFFDFIIPVIPVVNYSNSGEILRRELPVVNEIKNETKEISEKTIDDISLFIDDMRTLYNIVNEYNMYSSIKSKEKLVAYRLFAIIVYKNLYPKDFVELSQNKGLLYSIIRKNAPAYREKIIKDKQKEIENKKARLKEIETSDRTLSEKELRLVYLSQIVTHLNPVFVEFIIDEKPYNIIKCAEDKELFEQIISQTNVKYRYQQRYVYDEDLTFDWKTVQKEINPKSTYEQRLALLQQTEIATLQEDIRKLEHDIEECKQWTIRDILEQGNLKVEEGILDEKEKKYAKNQYDLIDIALRNNYINENYWEYISIFHEGSLTPSDKEFVINVKAGRENQYTHPLYRKENVIKALTKENGTRLLKAPNALNYDMMDYILTEREEYVSVYIETAGKDWYFVLQYIERGKNLNLFLTRICTQRPDFWDYICNNMPQEKDNYMRIIVKNTSAETIESFFKDRTETISSCGDFLLLDTDPLKLREIVEKLDIKFTELTKDIDNEDLLFIYEGCYYALRPEIMFFPLMILMKDYDSTAYVYRNYSYIINHYPEMANYIQQNISTYIDDVYLKLASDRKQTIESYHLVSLINNENLSPDQKKLIIQNSECKIDNVNEVEDVELRTEICCKNMMAATWENIRTMMDGNDEAKSACDEFLNIKDNAKQLPTLELKEEEEKEEAEKDLSYRLMHRNEINDDNFASLVKCCGYSFSEFGEDLVSEPHMRIMVENDKVSARLKGYQYLKKNYTNLHIRLLEKNISRFEDKFQELKFDASDIKLIIQSKALDNNSKQAIINSVSLDVLEGEDDIIKSIVKWLLDKKTPVENALNTGIMNFLSQQSCVDVADRKQLYIKFAQSIDEMIPFLTNLGKPYSDMLTEGNKVVFPSSEREFLKVLRNNAYVSTWTEMKKTGRIHVQKEKIHIIR